MMNNIEKIIKEQSKRHLSFYIYDENTIIDSLKTLKNDFPSVEFLYSAKTNPFPSVVKCVVENGLGIDAASLNEVLMGEKEGLAKEKIYYSAPGKTRYDILGAIEKSIIIADSLNELKVLNDAAKETGRKAKIGIRINPDFTFDSENGAGGKFGIDQDILFANKSWIKALPYVEFCGIHVHSRSQELDYIILEKYYDNMFKLAKRVQEEFDVKLSFINMGGGIGVEYNENDTPLQTKQLGEKLTQLIADFKQKLDGVKVIIETGRFAVGKSGTYVTTVIDKKVSYGKNYIILNNTLNGFIRPSLAMLVESYVQGTPKASEPLYTKPNSFKFKVLGKEEGEMESVTLCGNLCTGTDVVAKDILLPKIEIGDVLTMSNAGSYAAVLSPMQFASLTPPAQIFLTKDGLIK
ncbi:MAG: diaminopimelate decarboxylase [Oscillospiraceae bacterium]